MNQCVHEFILMKGANIFVDAYVHNVLQCILDVYWIRIMWNYITVFSGDIYLSAKNIGTFKEL